ncbi:hypothetical protein OS493_037992 [Desmophyllum pertusum]|uniref:Acyl-CoA dehydrogenase/oxidase C-terminal domain-containing protein n=1 Tax=Desmophyllum pertusum TaxID=174260 RepID=A0A9X0CTX6_9CNID|nr:hypothetical protein OS493_037992 [Desmophyllum pertusum]
MANHRAASTGAGLLCLQGYPGQSRIWDVIGSDEVRANTDDWSSLGMHGNQSGPLVCESTVTEDQLIGPYACWNGIAMGAIDIARRHVTTKEHADVGMRIADYPDDSTQLMDQVTDNNDWKCLQGLEGSVTVSMRTHTRINSKIKVSKYVKVLFSFARIGSLHPCWCWQLRFECAKNVNKATDKMMQACGGSGYKRDLGVERLLRDGRAGWVMGPSNEVLRQFVGKSSLFGLESLDLWSQSSDRRSLNTELLKLGDEEKMEIAQRLMREVAMNEPLETVDSGYEIGREETKYQDTEFDNPFNTQPPATRGPFTDKDGTEHLPALSPHYFVPLKLLSVMSLGDKQAEFSVHSTPGLSTYWLPSRPICTSQSTYERGQR